MYLRPATLKFDMKKKHVKDGMRCIPSACPVAQAIADRFNNSMDCTIRVSSSQVFIIEDDISQMTYYKLSKKLQKAIMKFDSTGKWTLPPGKYVLQLDGMEYTTKILKSSDR